MMCVIAEFGDTHTPMKHKIQQHPNINQSHLLTNYDNKDSINTIMSSNMMDTEPGGESDQYKLLMYN